MTRYIPANEWAPVLAGLKAPLGVHAILGNHDWWEDKIIQREGRDTPSRGARWKPPAFRFTRTTRNA